MSSMILDDMRDVLRRRHYSIRTERTYCDWAKRFILHFNMKSRDDLRDGEEKIERFLTFLARDRNVAPSTQNQALNALVFLYKQVLKQPLNEKINAERATKRVKIPVVLMRDETKRIIDAITGVHQLVVKLLDTDNIHCDLPQRGKNKQKRHDLRQVGLALVVTRQDFIPLFHHTYKGNMGDSRVFRQVLGRIKRRMKDLNMDLEKHTLVFDRGCNSKKNMALVARLKLHYVGALTPSHHTDLIQDAEANFTPANVGEKTLSLYRDRRIIWEEERTVVVFISQKLRAGQLRGIYQALKKRKLALGEIQRSLANPRAKKRTREKLTETIDNLLKGQFMKDLLTYDLSELGDGRFSLTYRTNKKKLDQLEDKLGFRILMTDRHEWSSEEVVAAFYGQSTVEQAFKNIKNPYHLAVTPEFHWTDQKIKVHYFSCILGYLLASLIWREARMKADFTGTLDTLIDTLSQIRLSTLLEISGKAGKPRATRQIEEMTDDQVGLMDGLNLADVHTKPLKIKGVSVYN